MMGATVVVRRNQADDPRRPGGILTLSAPEAEVRRIMHEEDLFQDLPADGLMAVELNLIFSGNLPMRRFPVSGDALVEEGFELVLYRRGKLSAEERKAMNLRTMAEVEEEELARAKVAQEERARAAAATPAAEG